MKKKILALVLAAIMVFACFSLCSFADETATAAPATATAEASTDDTASTGNWFTKYGIIIVYVVVLGGMFYFLIIRPNKKRKKEEEELKNSMCLGQDIVTIGGICGKIVSIKDDQITIQTSIDNTMIEVKNWAIKEVKKQETK